MRGLLLSLLLVSILGCGADRTTLVLNVSGLSADLTRLRVTASLDGAATTVQEYGPAAQLGLRLKPGARGAVNLNVEGLNRSGCVVSAGQARGYADGAARIDRSTPAPRRCPHACPGEDMRASAPDDLRVPDDLRQPADLRPPDLRPPPDLYGADLRGP